MEDRPEEPLAPGSARIRFGCGGICGSDLHYFLHGRTGHNVVVEPLILGHEIAGIIVAINGPDRGLEPGQQVAVNPGRACGRCRRCLEGRANLCENVFFMGSASRRPHMQGGFIESLDVELGRCHPVPDSVTLAHAALAEPIAVGLHAVSRSGGIEGRRVAVLGAGPIGLLLVALARLRGAAGVTAIDPMQAARDRALAMGADRAAAPGEALAGGEIDLVFEVSGSPAAVAAALDLVRRGGTVVQVGNLPGAGFDVPFNTVMAKELDVRGSFRFDVEFEEAVGLVIRHALPLDAMITGTAPLREAQAAFLAAADRQQHAKVILTAD